MCVTYTPRYISAYDVTEDMVAPVQPEYSVLPEVAPVEPEYSTLPEVAPVEPEYALAE